MVPFNRKYIFEQSLTNLKKIIFISSIAGVFFIACKKNTISRSSDKEIHSFLLPDLQPVNIVIRNDTITVKIPPGANPVNVIPDIEFSGKSISPAIGVPQNFTHPVMYTVTAEDGSTRNYVVLVSNLSVTKEIIDFHFSAAENSNLSSNAVGRILNDSSILVPLPATADVHTFVPTITHNGISISPTSGEAVDFSNPVYYTVTAEDGSTRKYKVWVSANSTVFIGSANGFVYALEAGSGQVKWSFNGGKPMGSPIYYQGRIYVAALQGGSVYCLDAETGSSIWSFANQSTIYTTPCVYNGTVYIGYTNTHSGLYALNATTGGVLWATSGSYDVLIANPAAVDGYVVITGFNTGVKVFNSGNGNLVWGNYPGIVKANPLVAGGVVYVGSESKMLTAYDLATGNIIWQNDIGPNPSGTPVMVNDVIYLGRSSYMYALNKSDGTVIWSQQSWGGYLGIGDNAHSGSGAFSAPAISLADNSVFAGCSDNGTYCLDLRTGAKKWVYPNSVEIKATSPNPVVAHGMLVVNREDNSLYAFSTRSGSILWKFTASGAINTDPCMTDYSGNVFYTGNSGNNN